MDLRYTEQEEEFRAELRAWLADVLPDVPPEPARDDWDARREWDTGWQRTLFEATDRLWDAITKLDTAAFDALVAEYPSLRHDCTCFFHAIEVGNFEAVESFLAYGADPNAPDESGRTPLWVASRTGGDLIVRRLVEAGGDPNVLPEDIDSEAELRGENPLFYAALHGDEELVAYLWPRPRPEVRSVARSVLAARLRLLDEPAAAESDPVEPGAAPAPAGR